MENINRIAQTAFEIDKNDTIAYTQHLTQLEAIKRNIPSPLFGLLSLHAKRFINLLHHHDKIGPYIVERMIGKGAMASVYLCQNTQEWVALKILESQHPPLVDRFLSERSKFANTKHEHIVQYIDHDNLARISLYLVMTYIDGIDLNVYTQKLHQRPPLERYARCRNFGITLVQTLSYVQAQGIIHRDIKPSNIFIHEEKPVLIDFGTVKQHSANVEQTQIGQMIGTPSYASPEQIYGGEITHLSDQFSMGATLYFMLTKQRPFDSIDRSKKIRPPSDLTPIYLLN